jgi:hypothetical protein
MSTGRSPRVSTTVARAVKAARDAGRMRPEHEPYAALARKVAAAIDTPALSTADLTRLSTQLTALLSRLPLGEEVKPDDGPDRASGGAGTPDTRSARLETGMGTRPAVGDTALA